ncbi:MAG: tetraacyldisaccharide 4'-kinase [Planctomycetota bacterium]
MADARGPLPRWLAPLAWPLARAYGAGVAHRNARFDRGVGVHRLEVGGIRPPVVSVGNLTAGGTGKSPFVAWIAREIAARGGKAVIAMRGYRGVSDGRGGVMSDEAVEYASTAPEALVVVGGRRREALGQALAGAPWLDRAVVVLDDGFQHRMLARDLDIVLVDATRPGLDGDLLPNGWLREPAHAITRVRGAAFDAPADDRTVLARQFAAAGRARDGLVVLTKADDGAERARAAASVLRWRGCAHDASCVHEWSGIEVAQGDAQTRALPVSTLAGARVVSACALGNPAHFHAMVERAGAQVAERLEKADHRAFRAEELESAARRSGARMVVMSRKDRVKLDRAPAVEVAVPALALRFLEGEDRARAAISALVSGRAARA